MFISGKIRYRDAFEHTPIHVKHFSLVCLGPDGQFEVNRPGGILVMNYEEDESQS